MDWILPLLAGIFILTGTGLGLYITYNANKQSNMKQQTIEDLNLEISKATKTNQILSQQILDITNNLKDISGEIQELATKNVDLTDKGLSLSEKSIELSEIITKIQTGGDSYPEVVLMNPVNTNILELHIINKGQYVLRSVSIKVEDYVKRNILSKEFKEGDNVMEKVISPSIKQYNIGNLIPKVYKKFNVIKLEHEILFLRIQIFTENGIFYQTIKWVDANTRNRKSYTKVEDKNHNIVYENYSPDFPKNEDGSFDLSFNGL